jgi:hypothetical protein
MIRYFPLAILFLCSCASQRLDGKRHHIVKKSYPIDTILISDYISCYGLRNTIGIESTPPTLFNKDSLFNHFEIALKNTDLVFKMDDNNLNQCDSIFHSYWAMKINQVDKKKIKSLTTGKNLTLVPFIYFDDYYRKYIYFSSTGVAGGGGYIKKPYLKMIVFLLDGDNIIYARSAIHFGKGHHVNEKEDIDKVISQDHWDKLVELVMKDYIKRLK